MGAVERGTGRGERLPGPRPRVLASLPLSGPAGWAGRELVRGAALALERAGGAGVELVACDADARDRDARALETARRAAADPGVLAYLGDFHSSQVAATAPLLADAELLGVTPSATHVGLGGPTLVRLMPHDGALARAISAWLVDAGVRDIVVVHDHDEGYGVPVGRMCVEAAGARGLAVRSRPVWDAEPPAEDLADAQALLYVGVPGSGAVDGWRRLHAARPDMWLLGTDGLAVDWFAGEIDAGAAERTRFFTAQRAGWSLYGFEAMSLILDAIAAGDGERSATAQAARATKDRDSALGRYGIDDEGLSTLPADGVLAVVEGRIAWDVPRRLSRP